MILTLQYFLACRPCLRCWKGAYRMMSSAAASRLGQSSHYILLGVQEDATAEEIKQAFLGQCKKLHPDSDPANPNLHSRFVKLNEAYSVLRWESSRREYDLALRLRRDGFSGATRTDPFGYTSPVRKKPTTRRWSRSDEERYWQQRYWQQFYHHSPEAFSAESRAHRNRRNKMLVWYCVLLMMGSLLAHYVGFRTVQKVHSNLVEEQNRVLTKVYNESKERARTNGVKKQHEILAQQQAEIAEKYRKKAANKDAKNST